MTHSRNHGASRSWRGLVATLAVGALALTGCAASDSGAPEGEITQEMIDEALNTPTTLTVWNWIPGIEEQARLFEEKYPAITVEVENVGNGQPHYSKIRTALQAGEGGADVVQVEYQYLSSFIVTESLLDLAPYGADKIAGDYADWIWNQVSTDGAVYAIPGDAGPMGLLYRDDILSSVGITEAPATWDDFAKAAEAVRATGNYITNLPPNNPGEFVGLLWQAGAKPFTYSGGSEVGIDLTSDRVLEVVDYWQDLIDRDLVATDADFNDAWYQGLASGKYASWLTAAWGPTYLQGYAEGTSGLWRAAPLPQWAAGENVAGNWGGSTLAVLKTTKNPIAAAELAKFMNHNLESAEYAANELFLFPTLTEILEDQAFIDQPVEFYGGQKVNAEFAAISETVDKSFDWLPYIDYAYASFNETLGKALADRGDLRAGLEAWQKALVDYGTEQGFTVNG